MSQISETAIGRWAPRFFTVWGADALALVGNRLTQFALVWWITSTTGSAAALASASMVVLLPQVLGGPFMGALIDRWNRRKVMIASNAVMAVASAVLAFIVWAGRLQVWHIYVVALIRAAAEQFSWTALASSTALMVPEKHLSRVAGINQTVQGVMNIAAPALGAILVTVLPLYGIMPVQIALLLVAIGVLSFSRIPQPAKQASEVSGAGETFLRDVRFGFRFIAAWKGFLIILLASVVGNMVAAPIGSLMPLFVTRVMGGGAVQLGMMESMMGVGIIGGGLVMGAWGGFRRRVMTLTLGLVGMSLGVFVTGIAPARVFAVAFAGMALGGFFNPIINAPLSAIMQAKVPPELQGRVFSAAGSMNQAAAPIGLLLAAPVADALGLRIWFFITAGVTIILGMINPLVPSVYHLEEQRPTLAVPSAETLPEPSLGSQG